MRKTHVAVAFTWQFSGAVPNFAFTTPDQKLQADIIYVLIQQHRLTHAPETVKRSIRAKHLARARARSRTNRAEQNGHCYRSTRRRLYARERGSRFSVTFDPIRSWGSSMIPSGIGFQSNFMMNATFLSTGREPERRMRFFGRKLKNWAIEEVAPILIDIGQHPNLRKNVKPQPGAPQEQKWQAESVTLRASVCAKTSNFLHMDMPIVQPASKRVALRRRSPLATSSPLQPFGR